jgi:hypothetical protein
MLKGLRDILKDNWIIISITIIGFLLRIIGLEFGKPFRFHPDELKLVYQAGNLLNVHNWSKDTFFLIGVYPPFFTYLLAIAFAVYSVILILFGVAPDLESIRNLYYTNPFPYHLIARWISVLSGTFGIVLVYLIGKRLYSKQTGLLAAAFLSVAFLHVRNSHLGTVDILPTLLVSMVFLFSVKILHNGAKRDYLAAGIFTGLAAATKWNAGLAVIFIFCAHFMQKKFALRRIYDAKLIFAGLACLIAFLIACPLPLIDFKEFFGGVVGTVEFQQTGIKKLGAGGGFWSYFTGNHSPGYGFFYDNSFPLGIGWAATILFPLGLVVLAWRDKREDILLIIFPILMYLIVGRMSYKAMRHLLPMVPFLLLIAAELMSFLIQKIQQKKIQFFALVVCSAMVILPQASKSLQYDMALRQSDTRNLMKDWIESNVPEGSKIGMEEFGPPLLSVDDLNFNVIKKSSAYKKSFEIYGLKPGMFVFANKRTNDHNAVDYLTGNEIKLVVLDSFTRSIYGWPFSRKRNPKVVDDRMQFYQWIREHGKLLHKVTPSIDLNICPTLEIYRLDY